MSRFGFEHAVLRVWHTTIGAGQPPVRPRTTDEESSKVRAGEVGKELFPFATPRAAPLHMQASARLPLRSIPVPQGASHVSPEEILPHPPVCYMGIVDKGTVSLSERGRRIIAGRGFVVGRGHEPMQVIPMVISRRVSGENC